MGLLQSEGIEPLRVRRSHLDIDFVGGGRILFTGSRSIPTVVQGQRLDLAASSAFLSYWDRRDVEASGATWV
jgi:hypothetical protein